MSRPLGSGRSLHRAVRCGRVPRRQILAIGDGIVHIRLFADRFGERPFQVDPAQLDQGPTDRYFGIRHLPTSVETFATWRPGAVGHEDVRADELDGYEIWREAYEARMKLRLART